MLGRLPGRTDRQSRCLTSRKKGRERQTRMDRVKHRPRRALPGKHSAGRHPNQRARSSCSCQAEGSTTTDALRGGGGDGGKAHKHDKRHRKKAHALSIPGTCKCTAHCVASYWCALRCATSQESQASIARKTRVAKPVTHTRTPAPPPKNSLSFVLFIATLAPI